MLPDMVRLKCRKISVMWNVAWCGMLRNARCGKLRCDVDCGEECHMQYAVRLLCDVRCGKRCNVMSCGGVM